MKVYLVAEDLEYERGYEVGLFDNRELAEEIAALNSGFTVMELEPNQLIGHLYPKELHEKAVAILNRRKAIADVRRAEREAREDG